MTRPQLWALFTLVVLLEAALSVTATDPETTRKLEQLEARLQAASAELGAYKGRKKKLHRQLRDAEQEIGAGERKIKATTLQLDAQRQHMARLERQLEQTGMDKQKQQEQVAQAIREAYEHGTQNRVKLLLNQEDPASVARLLNYYDYFNRARQADIRLYVKTLQQLQELKAQVTTTRNALNANLQTLQAQQQGLKASWQARSQTLAKLDASIKVKSEQFAELKSDQQKLEALLAAVEKQMAALDIQTESQSFSKRKGQMGWPTAGRIEQAFGARKADSQLRWQGVLMQAEAGSAVQAVHAGRIVFADWYGASGLLLIIEHGSGFMSLYAHNQSILREVGEWVSTGETIATVGQSGGKREPALYFEIRKSGKPVDPAAWCRSG